MLEWRGAMNGCDPGRLAWWEFDRMFLGWRRQQAILFAGLRATICQAAGAKVMPHHFSGLIPYEKTVAEFSESAREAAKQAFRDMFSKDK